MIIDEAQRVPHLFSYLQGIVDESRQTGRYILTGSQNYLLLEKITQSLAGRVAVTKLLPFSQIEYKSRFDIWRDKTGHEIDFLCSKADDFFSLEVKAGKDNEPDVKIFHESGMCHVFLPHIEKV